MINMNNKKSYKQKLAKECLNNKWYSIDLRLDKLTEDEKRNDLKYHLHIIGIFNCCAFCDDVEFRSHFNDSMKCFDMCDFCIVKRKCIRMIKKINKNASIKKGNVEKVKKCVKKTIKTLEKMAGIKNDKKSNGT